MSKPDLVKQAIRDRRLIREVAQRNVIPKIRNILLQSMLNQRTDSQLTAQQVRKILNVQMPQARQSGLQADGPMTEKQILGRNNQKVDMNMTDIARQKQTPDGVIVRNKTDTQAQPQGRMRQAGGQLGVAQAVPSDVGQINRDAQSLQNAVTSSDDQSQATGRRKSEVRAGLSDNPTQNISTSTQQNIQQQKKAREKMQSQNKDQWINQSIQRLDQVDVFATVGLGSNEPGRPDLNIIPQTFTDSDQIQVQNPERRSSIQQPSAVEQGATNDYQSNVEPAWQARGNPSSSYKPEDARRRMQRVRANTPRDAARRQTDKQDLTEILEDLNEYTKEEQIKKARRRKDKSTTEVPPGKKVITQDDAVVNQVKLLKLQNQKLINQVRKLQMLSNFIISNFSNLNQSKIKTISSMVYAAKQPRKLKQRYSKRSKMLAGQDLTQKKLFESNTGKFNKIRERRLNNKAETSRDPQANRLAELAGLTEEN